MAKPKTNKPTANGRDQARDEWLAQLRALVDQVEAWGREFDWSTRRIEKRLDDEAGPYLATGLMLQKEFTRVLLEPIGWSASGGGAADLYLMPAYDDLANLYYYDGAWHVHYAAPGTANARKATSGKLLTKKLFQEVVNGMTRHAAEINRVG
jgi:hypothetical protein